MPTVCSSGFLLKRPGQRYRSCECQRHHGLHPRRCESPALSWVCIMLKGAVRLALYGRQSFIWVLSHVFPPFFLCRSPRKGFLPHSCGVFRRWHAPRTSGHFVPKWLVAVLPLPGYSFSDSHSFFKVQLIDELPQVYTFSTACAVYP